jgi:hypothetical protein
MFRMRDARRHMRAAVIESAFSASLPSFSTSAIQSSES